MVVLLAFLCLRLIFWWVAFPNPDEAYYWLWGQRLEWSYYDHPPFHAWVQGLFSTLGHSPFVLRLPNLLSNGLLLFVYFKICQYRFGAQARSVLWRVLWLLLTAPLYFLFLALAWHDHWLITFCLLAMYWFITFADDYQATGHGQSGRLYGAGGAIALALLCKYNAVFVLAAFLATIVSQPRLRPLLRDGRLYLAGAIAASGLLPILIWNQQNDWQSFAYYVNRSVDSGSFSLRWDSCLGFLLFSLVMVSPWHCWRFWQSLRYPQALFRQTSTYATLAFWSFLIPTVILTIVSLLSAALYYWNITAYLLLFPLVADLETTATGKNEAGCGSFPALLPSLYGLLFAALFVIHYTVFPLSALIDQDSDPDSRMLYGWKHVATVVQSKATELGGLDPIGLFTTDYRSASAIAYQLNQPQVLAISQRIDQFDFWAPADNKRLQGQLALLLSDDWHPLTEVTLAQFQPQNEPITIPVTRFGRWIKNYYLTTGVYQP